MTFKRPTGAGLATLAILAGVCALALVEPALAQATTDAAKEAAPAAATGAAWVNRQVDFLPSWSGNTDPADNFSEALDGELARAARQGTGTGLLAVDIDHFKVLNDLHGHTIGDDSRRPWDELEDPHSHLSKLFDQEHDQMVVQELLPPASSDE